MENNFKEIHQLYPLVWISKSWKQEIQSLVVRRLDVGTFLLTDLSDYLYRIFDDKSVEQMLSMLSDRGLVRVALSDWPVLFLSEKRSWTALQILVARYASQYKDANNSWFRFDAEEDKLQWLLQATNEQRKNQEFLRRYEIVRLMILFVLAEY